METVIIVVHLMIVLALVGVVLLQRSEGGGLGIGGGSGFMTARGAANALTRTTAILAAAFFVTSLGLSLLARYGEQPLDILDRVPAEQGEGGGAGILDQLGGSDVPQPAPAAPQADIAVPEPAPATQPAGEAPAAPQPAPAAPQSGEAPDAAAPAAPPAMEAAPEQPAAPQAPAETTTQPSESQIPNQ
jgi:preprotein translocase subunit SecG